MARIECRWTNSCSLIGLIESPGSTFKLGSHGLDSATVVYTCPKKSYKRLTPSIGDKHPGGAEFRRMFCTGSNISFGPGWAKITSSYQGFIGKSTAKMPSVGATLNTMETPIQLHPNYQKKPESWCEDKHIFGDGPSPNRYGRVTDDADGGFKFFGPLPDGKNDRPQPAVICPGGNDPKDMGACRLQGIEAYLREGAIQYKYDVLTQEDWASGLVKDNLGKVVSFDSKYVPVPKLAKNADWLFTNCSVNATPLTARDSYFQTSLEFLGSGEGGWNKYLYQKGDSMSLDSLAGRFPA